MGKVTMTNSELVVETLENLKAAKAARAAARETMVSKADTSYHVFDGTRYYSHKYQEQHVVLYNAAKALAAQAKAEVLSAMLACGMTPKEVKFQSKHL